MSPTLSNIFQGDLHAIFNESCNPVDLNGQSFNSLSWADDLILVSTSQAGLQNCLTSLNTYCIKWDISINISKTCCMIMSKKKCKSNTQLSINGESLSYVDKTSYLGFLITSTLDHKAMMNDRILKANRAAYLLRMAISTGGYNINVKLALTLFDKMISPILLYGCSVWGLPKTSNLLYIDNVPDSIGDTRSQTDYVIHGILGEHIELKYTKRIGRKVNNLPQTILLETKYLQDKLKLLYSSNQNELTMPQLRNYDFKIENMAYELMHCRFLKFVMNVNKYASNSAIRGELGRLPLTIKISSLCVKYWHRMATGSTPNELLKCAYQSERGISSTWLHNIEYLLRTNGYGDVWYTYDKWSSTHVYIMLKNRLSDQYVQNWFSNSPLKAQGMDGLKTSYILSDYLVKIISTPMRAIFSKLRINNSILKCSMRGVGDSNCPMCDDDCSNETVSHFVLECKQLEAERKKFMLNLTSCVSGFEQLSKQEQLVCILDLKCAAGNDEIEDEFVNITVSFVKEIYTIRSNYNNK